MSYFLPENEFRAAFGCIIAAFLWLIIIALCLVPHSWINKDDAMAVSFIGVIFIFVIGFLAATFLPEPETTSTLDTTDE